MRSWKKSTWFWLGIFALFCIAFGVYVISMLGRPPAFSTKYELYPGVTYQRVVRYLPRAMIAHVIVIDRKEAQVSFLVTPPDQVEGGSVKARTTSEFLNEFGVQIAINGDGFSPWWSRSPIDYYPHQGDPVTPLGFAAAFGKIYSDGLLQPTQEPTLYISRRNELTFNRAPGKVQHAISGDRMLLLSGSLVTDLDDTTLQPRTAIGVNRNGRYVILMVVDGRQPFYSSGVTFKELASLMKNFDAFFAMALDGGGSSTLVVQNPSGITQILNSPIDNYIPGRERPVANHIGVMIKP